MKLRRHLLVSAIVLFFSVIINSHQVLGQTIGTEDLSKVRVDDLSDEQILAYLRQAESMGLSEEEMTQAALQRGMPVSEIKKLRTRISTLKASTSTSPHLVSPVKNRPERQITDTVINEQAEPDSMITDTLPIFGAALFRDAPALFEPNLRLATPKDYVLGPGDQVLIDIYGKSEESHSLNVTPEGTINIPYVGVVSIAGMTMEQATERIKKEMSTIYRAIRSGETNVTVALGNIRSIKVIITGEVVKPGTYTLPSVATVFNALYYSGGPSENGSFRNIRVIRAGKTVAELDIYDFLISGNFKSNIRLEDQDVLMIPPYVGRVEMRGEIKRPAVFELKEGETFQDLLNYAGGFTEDAYRARIKVTK